MSLKTHMQATLSKLSRSSIVLKSIVLVTSVTQALSPVFSSFDGQSSPTKLAYTNPKIIPAGYAFAVWGVITTLSWIYGFYQIGRNRKNEFLHVKVAPYLIWIYILFSLWLFAAGKEWLIVTVVTFIVMYLLLCKVLLKCNEHQNELNLADKILLQTQIGIYAGWTAVAIFANIASAVKFYGGTDSGNVGNTWQGLLLLFATMNIIWGIRMFKGNAAFILTSIWAVVGIYFGLNDEREPELLKTLTITFGAIVITYAITYRIKQARNSKPELAS